MPRPNLSAYWASRIEDHVYGTLAGPTVQPPRGVTVKGQITDRVIEVTDAAGKTWLYEGGRYASKKRAGCYAPLVPRPVKTEV